jgi:translocation and assembly module TamA
MGGASMGCGGIGPGRPFSWRLVAFCMLRATPATANPLRTTPRRAQLGCALLLAFATAPAAAAPLRAVRISGVDGDALANVEATLSLTQLTPRQRAGLSEARLSYLLRRAPEQVERALQPYGYYEAKVVSEVQRQARGIVVVLVVTPGEPVRVVDTELAMEGAAAQDRAVMRRLQRLRPRRGDTLDHRLYEAGKLAVQRRLLERGYFDAELVTHRVEVRRKAREAVLRLHWQSGVRYRLGEVRFDGAQIDPELLRKVVPFEPGIEYHQRELIRLQQRLTDLDYFGYIDVRPDVEAAVDGQVPVAVSLTPGKRSVYTAGVSYGTDAGAGLQLGLDRRWLNARGHKFGVQLDYAERRKSLAALYRIPAFEWAEGWYAFGANRREEDSEFVRSRISELVAQRTGRLGEWDLGVALHVLNESFELGREAREVDEGQRRLVYPALSAGRKQADHELYPRRGWSVRGELRAGHGAIGSQADFAQLLLEGRWIRSFGPRTRLLLRGQAGRTASDEFDALPPSLRFYAGGDRSIRGYGYQEVGPRREDQVVGGRHLLIGSVELERMFSRRWGAAVFVDAGDAYDTRDAFRLRSGIGAGVRWRSPVGLVRVDLAHGLDADNAVQLHINIGPDL